MMDARKRRIKFFSFSIISVLLLTIVLLVTLSKGQQSDPSYTPKLLLISLDGFYYRYLEQFPNETRFLRENFAENGVFAPNGFKSVFATKTLAVHWTMATGLYEESHGIMGNKFYDPFFNETFTGASANNSKWFDGEPVWSVAQKQGLRVGVSQWMGSMATFTDDRQSPTFLDPFEKCVPEMDFGEKLNVIYDFLFQKNADFAMLYFCEPDSSGHWYGASSEGVRKVLATIDSKLEEFMGRIADRNINTIILSDHGMRNVTKRVHLDDKLPDGEKMDQMTDYADDGPVVMEIWPKAGLLGKLYKLLDKIRGDDFDVYLKDDIPDRWHFSHHRRNSPLLLVARDQVHVWKKMTTKVNLTADHGYDNELDSMRPFFVASGPAFREKSTIEPIGLENIYALCCHLLNITPNANNGSVAVFESILKDPLNV